MSTSTNPLANCSTKEQVLAKVAAGEASVEQAVAWMDTQGRQKYNLRFKVSEKGGISVYGLQSRFPVTLYPEQWEALYEQGEQLKAFIAKPETQKLAKANQTTAKAAKAMAKVAERAAA
jgi:hypothetical protein